MARSGVRPQAGNRVSPGAKRFIFHFPCAFSFILHSPSRLFAPSFSPLDDFLGRSGPNPGRHGFAVLNSPPPSAGASPAPMASQPVQRRIHRSLSEKLDNYCFGGGFAAGPPTPSKSSCFVDVFAATPSNTTCFTLRFG